MKSLTRSLLLALALTTGAWVPVQAQAQTYEQSFAAYQSKDYRTAFAGFKKLAEQGHVDAQFYLGSMYSIGQGVPKDDRQAVVWYRKSAEQGDKWAQYSLGLMYANGRGVPKDEQQAVVWYRKAAEQGNASAQFNLGVMYDHGRGVPKDDQQAVVWYRKAAEQGRADAQFNLGVMYTNGQGVPKDEQQAVAWYMKAAEQGDADAQSNLGAMYANGRGVPKDDQQAVVWRRKAAEQGNAIGQAALGAMFDDGRGVPKDEQSAYFWYLLASAQGNQNAASLRDFVERRLSPEQRAAAQASARNWQPKTAAQSSNVPGGSSADSGALAPAPSPPASSPGSDSVNDQAEKTLERMHPDWRDVVKNKEFLAWMETLPKSEKDRLNASWDPYYIAGKITEFKNLRSAPATAQADSSGSGFRVARGAIVTNHHVIDGCSRLRVNGTAAQVRGSDARSDLALLGVNLPGPSASLRSQRAAVGEPVAVAGYPLRGLLSGFNLTTGNLSSLSGIGGDTRLLQITAPVQPGNSGGPMLDSAGNLMGVVVSKLNAVRLAKITGDIPQNVNFAIHANVLRTFLDANSVDYDSASSNKPLTPTAIAEKARGFTVLVEYWK